VDITRGITMDTAMTDIIATIVTIGVPTHTIKI
jgi:hypothetical protein